MTKKNLLVSYEEGHFILKGRTHPQDITILFINILNRGVSNFIKQITKDVNRTQDNNNNNRFQFLTFANKSSKQKVNREIYKLDGITNQMDLIAIYKQIHSNKHSSQQPLDVSLKIGHKACINKAHRN